MTIILDEQQHPGGVKSRTHQTCLVVEPVVVMVEGKETELSLSDAMLLRAGLTVAIERVEQSENVLKGNGNNYHCACIAKSGTGQSFPRSKLGDGQAFWKPF